MTKIELVRNFFQEVQSNFGVLKRIYSFQFIINILSMATRFTTSLSQIVCFIPNLITGFRLILNYCALFLFGDYPQLSCFLLMVSVLLDYVDGYAARKYNQCSFFGDIFDWVVDISSSAAVYFWWATLEPRLTFAVFTLLTLQIISMVVDIIAKSHGYCPMVRNDDLTTLILKYTMNCNRRGASYVGLGYWNEILHYFCIVSRVLFLQTTWLPWNYLFYATLPASLSYVWMNLAYAKNISDTWNETNENNQSKVVFIEEK